MGPIVSPWTVARPGWLAIAILALPLSSAVGLYLERDRAAPPPALAAAPMTDADATGDTLRELARAHYRWIYDHGAGCARSTEHLVPYARGASARDAWGSPIAFTCQRYFTEGHDVITWSVRSPGRDRIAGTADDLTAAEHWDRGLVAAGSAGSVDGD